MIDSKSNELNWQKQLFFTPEDVVLFNSSRILLLFEMLEKNKIKKGIDLERISYYDFFSANPFLAIKEDDPLWIDLEIAGFKTHTLGYISSSQRFRTKRSLLKQYLSLLLSKNLIEIYNSEGKIFYKITITGLEATSKMNSMYAITYRKGASLIINRFKKYSDEKLWGEASEWLEAKSFQVDLYDMSGDNYGNDHH